MVCCLSLSIYRYLTFFFLHDSGYREQSRVILCGFWKKIVAGFMYLHELHWIFRETGTDQSLRRTEICFCSTDTLAPESYITADDRSDVVLIYSISASTKIIPIRTFLVADSDGSLDLSGNLWVCNYGWEKQGMSTTALWTSDSAYIQRDLAIRSYDKAFIVTVDTQAAMMAAGASQPVKREWKYYGIVEFLCKGVAILDKYC